MQNSHHFLKMDFNLTSFRAPPPSVMWAQRSEIVLVTINLEDCKDPQIKYVAFCNFKNAFFLLIILLG